MDFIAQMAHVDNLHAVIVVGRHNGVYTYSKSHGFEIHAEVDKLLKYMPRLINCSGEHVHTV